MVQMLIGLLIGLVVGLLAGPVLRSWLTWREYREASREAQLTDDVLRVMSRPRDDAEENEAAEAVRTR